MKRRTKSRIAIHCAFDEMKPVAELRPHPKNANKHPEQQIALLAEVIRRSGWRHPIIISKRSGLVCAGHGRLMAAQAAGLDVAPVNYQDFKDEAQEIEFLIADNRIQELAEMDADELRRILKDTPKLDPSLAGFDEQELRSLLREDSAGDLAEAITLEEKFHADDAPDPEAVISSLSGHIRRLAERHPERLRDALAVVIPHGRGHTADCLVLADPACSDAAQELRRHVDERNKSPVAALLSALLPMKGKE